MSKLPRYYCIWNLQIDILTAIYDFGFQLKSHDSWQVIHVFNFFFSFSWLAILHDDLLFIYFFFSLLNFCLICMGLVNMISSLTLGPKWNHELTNEITFASDSYDWTIIFVRMVTLSFVINMLHMISYHLTQPQKH